MLRQVLTLLMFFLLCYPLTSGAEELGGVVTWIHDGDTIEVRGVGRVRLLGIDTPEMEASTRDIFYIRSFSISEDRLRKVAQQARKYLIDRIKGQYVELVLGSTKKDKYDRYLAYVYLENSEMVNLILLEKGYASVFRRYTFSYKSDFLDTEKQARDAGKGLWQDFK
jgi:micrococcal nuclease